MEKGPIFEMWFFSSYVAGKDGRVFDFLLLSAKHL